MRTKLALLAAVILGFLAAIGVRSYLEQQERKAKGPHERVAILVAREAMNRGDIVREHMVKAFDAEVKTVTAMNILFDQRKPWIGQPLARKVRAEEALLKTDFIPLGPGPDGPAPQFIPTGWRAITIGVDQISGVGGLITPKSRVDILGTFREGGGGPNVAAAIVTRVVARNVEVIAVDNRTELSLPARALGRAPQADRGYSSITILVTPLEASLLTFAQGAGKLSCSLRRPDDTQPEKPVSEISDRGLKENIGDAAQERELKTRQPTKSTTPP